MNPTSLRKCLKKKGWTWFDRESNLDLPASQGYLLVELVKKYKIGWHKLGYNQDIVGIAMRSGQTILWKNTGIGARFLGIVNKDGSVSQHQDDLKPVKTIMFEDRKKLLAEVRKKDYDGIVGFTAEISEVEYMDALEVMPPLKMGPGWFIMREAFTDGVYEKFYHKDNKHYCTIITLSDETIEKLEVN